MAGKWTTKKYKKCMMQTIVVLQSSRTGKSRTAAGLTTMVCIGSLLIGMMFIYLRTPKSTGASLYVFIVWEQVKICMMVTCRYLFLCSLNIPGNMQPGSLKVLKLLPYVWLHSGYQMKFCDNLTH